MKIFTFLLSIALFTASVHAQSPGENSGPVNQSVKFEKAVVSLQSVPTISFASLAVPFGTVVTVSPAVLIQMGCDGAIGSISANPFTSQFQSSWNFKPDLSVWYLPRYCPEKFTLKRKPALKSNHKTNTRPPNKILKERYHWIYDHSRIVQGPPLKKLERAIFS
jgi:hypothetical protein